VDNLLFGVDGEPPAHRVIANQPATLFTLSFFFQAEDGIRDFHVTGVQTCALPISIGTCTTTGSFAETAKKSTCSGSRRRLSIWTCLTRTLRTSPSTSRSMRLELPTARNALSKARTSTLTGTLISRL